MDILPVSEDKLSKPYAFAKITIRVKNIFQCLPAGANSFTYFISKTNKCLRIFANSCWKSYDVHIFTHCRLHEQLSAFYEQLSSVNLGGTTVK